jgi:hypothetical protein
MFINPSDTEYLLNNISVRTSQEQYTTSRKVAGLIPDEVIWFFSWRNPSSRIMALGSTWPLTEMRTRNLPWGKGRPARKADNLTVMWADRLENVGASTSHNPMSLHSLLQGELSFYTSQETHYISTTKISRLMPFRETNAVQCENHMKHTSTLFAKNSEFWYVKAGGTYSNHGC